MHWRRRSSVPAVVALGIVGWLLPAAAALAGQGIVPANTARRGTAGAQAAAQAAGYVGQDTCLTCHADKGKVYSATAHGHAQNPGAPAAQHGCETCHGAGKAHVDAGGDKTKIKTFTGMSAAQINETCVTCHNRAAHADWVGSVHDRHNLSCTTCHSIHNFKSETAQLKTASDVDTCMQCHQTEALKVRRVAHMPLREGKMGCTSCHNPHGSSNVRLLRAGSTIAESCTTCHAYQRGPYLWEHAPVRDKCTTCHDPHGSSNDRMLVAKMPMLCQRCHVSTRHPSVNYDASLLPPSTSTSGNRLVNRSCINCHQAIHGSNHPGGLHFLR
jgi:DmsE family decaheme c-type cytochrome